MNGADWLETFLQIVTLRGGYNTIVVMIGVSLLGVAAGAIGAFALLRNCAKNDAENREKTTVFFHFDV